ncbi:hypothetical protein [Brevibacillus borstelensis]|uniref:hypothetical protein n=1 Tax=Brevibacillus borstelensis TaxID=45462 RepID=UPI0030C50360
MWSHVFDREYRRGPKGTESELETFLRTWNAPLSQQEIQEIAERRKNPFPANLGYEECLLTAGSFRELCMVTTCTMMN